MTRKLLIGLLILSLWGCNLPLPAPTPENTLNSPAISTEPGTSTPPAEIADVIFSNGTIITMDDANPKAEAIAIGGDKILAVGTNEAILKHKGDTTILVDLHGLTLLPGFIDSHEHRIGDREMGGYTEPDPVIQAAIEQGWTSIDELFVHEPRLEELRSLGLRLRVNAYLPLVSPQGDSYGKWYQPYQPGFEYSPYLRLAGVKIFMDHGFGLGTPLFTQEELDQMVLEAHRLGWQIAAHTLSETAHTLILNSLERALGGTADDHYRHRIEHVLVISDSDIQRMKRLGIIASVQLWGSEWVDFPDFYAETTPDLYPHFVRTRDLLGTGVVVVGSTDWPYGNLEEPGANSPMLLLYQAVTQARSDRRPGIEWALNQAIPIEQALRLLTINGAYATSEENKKGSLAPGKLADMVILSENPLTAPIESVPDIDVLMTMIGGKVEYCATGREAICPGTTAPAVTSPKDFAGTWVGPDPDDGSMMAITIVQSGNTLTSTFKDTYSGNLPPPGFEGAGEGAMLTPTTAQMTFHLSRYDGVKVELPVTLLLSDQNNTLTITVIDPVTTWVFKRQ